MCNAKQSCCMHNYDAFCSSLQSKSAWQGLQRTVRLHNVNNQLNRRKLQACQYTLQAINRGTRQHFEDYRKIKQNYQRGLQRNLAMLNSAQNNFMRNYNMYNNR